MTSGHPDHARPLPHGVRGRRTPRSPSGRSLRVAPCCRQGGGPPSGSGLPCCPCADTPGAHGAFHRGPLAGSIRSGPPCTRPSPVGHLLAMAGAMLAQASPLAMDASWCVGPLNSAGGLLVTGGRSNLGRPDVPEARRAPGWRGVGGTVRAKLACPPALRPRGADPGRHRGAHSLDRPGRALPSLRRSGVLMARSSWLTSA